MGLLDQLSGCLARPQPPPGGVVGAEGVAEADLARALSGADGMPEESRVGSDYIHVTSLIDPCARLWKIADRFGLPAKVPTSSDRLVWAIGRAVERHVRGQVIRALPGKAWGHWRCHKCGVDIPQNGDYLGDATTREESGLCKGCKGEPCYVEVAMFDHDAKVVGSMDLGILENGKVRVVEIKSITQKGFEKIKAKGKPEPDHSFQAFAYKKLLEAGGVATHPRPLVIYGRKEYQWASPYFVCEADPKLVPAVGRAWEFAEELRSARAGDQMPSRHHLCKSADSSRAKKCPGCPVCFSI